jgi:hypothetical protein
MKMQLVENKIKLTGSNPASSTKSKGLPIGKPFSLKP